jgi:hypothetical protein
MQEDIIMRATISFMIQFLTKTLLPSVIVLAATYGANAQRTQPVAKGDWGGTGIAMTVTDTGGSIQFDCADGTITSELRMKNDGSFRAEGTLTRNGPGPVRTDQTPVGRAVIFKGKVNGKSMSITMTDAKTGERLGEYVATHGQEPRLHRCA